MTELDRRLIAKEFTRRTKMGLAEILDAPPIAFADDVRVVAFTGPPGTGKSSLIAQWGLLRVESGRHIAVLAIDPSSPVSGGAILGDRVRMDALGAHPRAMVRSFSSRTSLDGLCPNVTGVIEAAAAAGFDNIVVETVGVGQTAYAARDVVHTLVLVLNPESGDTIQAMKAGVIELADIFVVNKSDLPGAERLVQELRGVVDLRRRREADWYPRIVSACSLKALQGFDELDAALEAHALWRKQHASREIFEARVQKFRLRQLIAQQMEGAFARHDAQIDSASLRKAFEIVVRDIAEGAATPIDRNAGP